MKHILFYFLLLQSILTVSSAWAQYPELQSASCLSVLTDKTCYLAGERLQVSIHLAASDPSRIAYVEVADTRHLFAQCMVEVEAGKGWGSIALPTAMHSGNYALTVYTRQMLADGVPPYSQVISVVNVGHVTRADRITFLRPDSLSNPVVGASYAPQQSFPAFRPVEAAQASIVSLTVSACDLITPDYSATQLSFQQPRSTFPLEYEGHVVTATAPQGQDPNQAYLSRVGKVIMLFEGQNLGEGRLAFYTQGLNGRLPTSLTAVNDQGSLVPLTFESPYARLLPKQLPELQVTCTEVQLRQRSLSAQREQLLSRQAVDDTTAYSTLFMGDEPSQIYDLDEWRRFSSVREIIIEFVRQVTRRKEGGVNNLYIYDPVIKQLSHQPALVLLDGMPIYDLDRFLAYDARLLKYVQIYTDNYVFGNLFYHGAISFISQRGRLANYKLETGEQLVNYEFPQLFPDFVAVRQNTAGTLFWCPDVRTDSLQLTAPHEPGFYQLLWQWIDTEGKVQNLCQSFEVK